MVFTRSIAMSLMMCVPMSLGAQDRVVIQGGAAGGTSSGIGGPQSPIPPRDVRPPATGTSRIRGRVIAADTGQPIPRATVRVNAPELRVQRSTTTEEDGTYEFRDLAAGRYTLTSTKTGYVNLNFGQTRPNEAGRPIELRDKQVMERVDFTLPRGAVITGRVIDEFGEPVSGVSVQPVQYRFVSGRRQLAPVSSSALPQTDDTGAFRIWGLMPGTYSLLSRQFAGLLNQSDDRMGFGTVYYPGTPSETEAQFVRLNVGQTLNDLLIVLTRVRLASVSGKAVDSQGRPARGTLSVGQRFEGGAGLVSASMSNVMNPDGSFTLRGLTPGEYTITATGLPPGPGLTAESLTATVTVDGVDVTDVVLAPIQYATLSGRIVADRASTQPPPTASIRVSSTRRDQQGAPPPVVMGAPTPVVRDDLSFELRAAPGATLVRATITAPDWMLKAVRRNGLDITDTGLDIGPGEAVNDLEVEVTNRLQDVSGGVTDSRSQPVTEYSVIFFARDPERRQEPTRFFGTGRPDQEGRYRLRALPPGEYYAVAVDYFDPMQRGDLDFLRELERSATPFTLGEGETRVLNLTLAAR